MSDCCQETPVSDIKTRLIGQFLYVTYNGKTTKTDLSSLVTTIDVISTEVNLEISYIGQIYFVNAIPNGKQLIDLFVEGLLQKQGKDYTIVGNNITWTSDLELIPEFNVILKITI